MVIIVVMVQRSYGGDGGVGVGDGGSGDGEDGGSDDGNDGCVGVSGDGGGNDGGNGGGSGEGVGDGVIDGGDNGLLVKVVIVIMVKMVMMMVAFPLSTQNVPPDLSICTFVLEQSLSVRALQEMLANTMEKSEGASIYVFIYVVFFYICSLLKNLAMI